MISYYGDYAEDSTVYLMFNTFSSDDPSASVTITNLADADIKVHKDGSATQIVTDGATVSIDFDTITGNHLVTIDTSVHADYSTGSDYQVRMEGTTIDGETINAWIGTFSIENRFTNVTKIAGTTQTANDNGADINTLVTQVGTAGDGLTAINLPNQTMDITGDITGSLSGSVGSVTGAVGSVTGHTNQTGDNFAIVNGAAGLVAIDTVVDGIQTDLSNTTDGLGALKILVDRNADLVESQRGSHSWQGNVYYVSPNDGNDSTGDGTRALPYATIQAAHDDLVTDSNHDVIILVSDATGATTHTVAATTTISKRYCFIRGPGRDFIITRSGNGDTMEITADGVELSGFQITRPVGGTGNALQITDADFARIHEVWFNATRADAINVLRGENCQIHNNTFTASGQAAASAGIHIDGTSGTSNDNVIRNNIFRDTVGDGIKIENGTTNNTTIQGNIIEDSTLYGISIQSSSANTMVLDNRMGENASGNLDDSGTDTTLISNDDLDTAISELSAQPGATPTLREAVMLLYMALRNKTVVQTLGTDALEIHNNAGTKIGSKALTDDGSDYTEAQMA